MASRKRTITLGIALAVAILATIANAAWIAVLLFVVAAFLIAWALDAKRTEAFVGRLPYGSYLLKALAKLDSIISGWS
jgi:fucose permease